MHRPCSSAAIFSFNPDEPVPAPTTTPQEVLSTSNELEQGFSDLKAALRPQDVWVVESLVVGNERFENKADAIHFGIQISHLGRYRIVWWCGTHTCDKCLGDKAYTGDAGLIECPC